MRPVLAVVMAGFVALSGCSGVSLLGGDDPLPACTVPVAHLYPTSMTMGGASTEHLILFPNEKTRFAEVVVPENWKWAYEDLGGAAQNGTFVKLKITPGPMGPGPGAGGVRPPPGGKAPGASMGAVYVNWTSQAAHEKQCDGPAKGSYELGMAGYAAGGGAGTGAPGKGAHVSFAGFGPDGKLFATNMNDIDSAEWPRAASYKFEGPAPRTVFIYNQAKSEGDDSKVWNPPADPAGKPSWRYVTMMKGFNDALKGLASGLPKIQLVKAEDNEATDPALQGQPITYYVVIQEVVDVPCPPENPQRNACRPSSLGPK